MDLSLISAMFLFESYEQLVRFSRPFAKIKPSNGKKLSAMNMIPLAMQRI